MATLRRTRRRRRRPEWLSGPAWGGIILGAAALIAIVLMIALRPDPVPRDPDTLCPEAGPSGVTAILIDTTDHIGPISRTDILGRLADLAAASETDEMLLVYDATPVVEHVRSDADPFPPVLRICNPGDPDEASEWTSNPALVRRHFEEGFRQPLEELFSDLIYLGEPANQSPLMENVQAISVTVLARLEHSRIPKRLILVSDLLQHSGHLSLYRGLPDYDAWASSSGAAALRTDLGNVDIEALFVQRREHERFDSSRDLIDFWDRWTADQQGRLLRVSRVDGLN